MTILQNVIRAIRNIRSKMNIKEKQKLDALISISGEGEYNLKGHSGLLKRMANLERLKSAKILQKPNNAASEVIGQIQAFVPLEGHY